MEQKIESGEIKEIKKESNDNSFEIAPCSMTHQCDFFYYFISFLNFFI